MRRKVSDSRKWCLVLGVALAAAIPAAGIPAAAGIAAAQAGPAPFGHPCITESSGARFCQTTDAGPGRTVNGVPSFDGVPLDVDVSLPPTSFGNGPYPTIVMLSGWGGSKTQFETTNPDGDGATTYDYNTAYYATQGYAVVTYSPRGFGHSCGGGPAVAATFQAGDPCANGYTQLADPSYEGRDAQYLLGLLVDEGITNPSEIGVTGASYGAGQAMELAYLNTQIRLPDGTFAPWTSPDGTPLSIAAAWVRFGWSDLVQSLLPNGQFLDSQVAPPQQSLNPLGIERQNAANPLYQQGQAQGYYCGESPATTPCEDPDSDITSIIGSLGDDNSATQTAATELYNDHQAYGLPGPASPLLIENGWTDDLYPPEEAIRVYNQLSPTSPVTLQFGDVGHSPADNKSTVTQAFAAQGGAFFDAYLQHTGSPPAPGSVTAYTQTCPLSVPDGGPYTASSYPALSTGQLTLHSTVPQTVTGAGDPTVSQKLPQPGGSACNAIPTHNASGTAVYSALSHGVTMLGLPTVTATVSASGADPQLDAQLFDVMPNGTELLVSRSVYALTANQTGTITFQLHGNGYYFPAGDTMKLVLLGADLPYLARSLSPFTVTVSSLSVSIPTVGS
jgi:pimeloyl-ACP methyl ester carboxylesterase